MRKNLLLVVAILYSIVFAQTLIVSAQLPNFNVYFNSRIYDLGSTGVIIIDIQTFDFAFDIKRIGVKLNFSVTDGTNFESEFFGENYGENPFQIPANNKTSLPVSFVIPDRTDLKSGHFYYLFEVDIRPQNTTSYSTETHAGEAMAYGEYCIIFNPDSLPSPEPTSELTPTPAPTNPSPTPTVTPTPENTDDGHSGDTIALSPIEIALIVTIVIAIVFGIIAVWALKRK